jgi:type I restriction enzyme S subunit
VGDDALAEIFSMSAPVLVSQFDLLAGAPGGVARLRELILLLAVRGKLTAQHPTDEPAHVLLQRIQDAKALHVPRGGRRAAGTAVEVNESDLEVLDSLPPGWVWSSLSSIGLISPRNEAEDAAIASFVPMSAIPVAFTDAHETESRPWLDIKSGFTHFAEGDVGVAKITPCFENGKSTVFKDLCNGIGAGTTELYVVRPLCGVTPRYVLLFLKSPGFLKGGEAVMTGTAGQKRLPRAFFEDCPFPLPPLAEQARIVARVDELMQLCDALEAKGRLEEQQHARLLETLLGTLTDSTTPEELAANWQRVAEHFDLLLDQPEAVDVLEQTVLQLAVRGVLVPQDPTERTPPADSNVLRRSGSDPIDEAELPYDVPSNWQWIRLGSVADLINGDRGTNYPNKSEYVATGLPFINTGHIEPDGTLSHESMHYLTRKKFESLRGGKTLPGDLVYCLRGATLGKTAIVEYPEGAIASSLVIIRLDQAIDRKYMYYYLTGPMGKSLVRRFDNGSAQPNLAANSVKRYVVPLPPAAEQRRIVARVEELRCLCADLRQRLAASQATQSRLAEALVEAATA